MATRIFKTTVFALTAISLLAESDVTAQCEQWISVPQPLPRSLAQAVYDLERGVVVFFGGWWGEEAHTETWELSDQRWVLAATNGPSARQGHAMSYDSDRKVTTLFGGYWASDDPSGDDTWDWDGLHWTKRDVVGPGRRRAASMTYDSARRVTVLHGGFDEYITDMRDTWEWNGITWTLRASNGPPSGLLSFDPVRHVAVLVTKEQSLTTTWEWDGNEWMLRDSGATAPKSPSQIAYDPSLQATLVTEGSLNQTWTWNGTRWLMHPVTQKPNQGFGVLVCDIHANEVLAFGGQLSWAPTGDDRIWRWNGVEWVNDGLHSPTPRWHAAASYDSGRNVLVLATGSPTSLPCPYLPDTWEWDGASWELVDEEQTPNASCDPQMAYDASTASSVLLSQWTCHWNGSEWQWFISNEPPQCRFYSSMAFDAARQSVIRFGGSSSGWLVCGTTWEWDVANAQWHVLTHDGPSPRASAALCYDESRNVTVLFGGFTNSATYSDTWEFDSKSAVWSKRNVGGPPWSHYSRMVYYRKNKLCVLYVPQQDEEAEVWLWDGNQWNLSLSPNPPSRLACNLVYDTLNDRPVLFGGRPHSTNDIWLRNDIWMLVADPAVRAQPVDYWVAPSQSARFVCDVRGSQPLSLHWQKNGIPLNDDGRITGSQTTSLVIHDVIVADEGSYDLVISNACGGTTSDGAHLDVVIPGDVTNDNVVNVADLLLIINSWGPCPSAPSLCPADIAPVGFPSGDDVVNVLDLLFVINHWG